MNEWGREYIKFLSMQLVFLGVILSAWPYMIANNLTCSIEFSEIQVSEHYYWIFIHGVEFALLVSISVVVSTLVCYLVYIVQRSWFLYKLRKPERVYTGDNH